MPVGREFLGGGTTPEFRTNTRDRVEVFKEPHDALEVLSVSRGDDVDVVRRDRCAVKNGRQSADDDALDLVVEKFCQKPIEVNVHRRATSRLHERCSGRLEHALLARGGASRGSG